MISTAHAIWPVVTAILACLMVWRLRSDAQAAAATKLAHLLKSAELLALHAKSLDAFLSDSASPADLKNLLIGLSDALADRETVQRLSEWIAGHGNAASAQSPEIDALVESLQGVMRQRPDLFECFMVTAASGLGAAALRWSKDAATALAVPATPKHEISTAYVANMLRNGGPFSIRTPSPAMA